MTKTELIEQISETSDIPKSKVNSIVTSVFELIKEDVMKKGNTFQVQNFGKFEKKVTNIKKGTDPITNKEVVVRQNETLKFTGSKK